MDASANNANTPAIRYGINAGRPRPINEIILDGMTRARLVVIQLKRDGFTVIGVDVDSARPTVQVMACKKTAELILLNKACYYKWVSVQGAAEKHGQFQIDGVRVVWVERSS